MPNSKKTTFISQGHGQEQAKCEDASQEHGQEHKIWLILIVPAEGVNIAIRFITVANISIKTPDKAFLYFPYPNNVKKSKNFNLF